jgi:tetratricopeptide (TPR) repeat protein
MGLLEREAALECIDEQFRAATTSGRLVLVSGEAGVGKTALVDAFCSDRASDVEVLIGRCDDLFAPRPFGPLADIARTYGGGLREALHRDDREAALDAFLDLLTAPPGQRTSPVVIVIEDLQWADEATLDLVRYVARRLPQLRCLVVATYRDDIGRDHPLQLTLGDLVQPAVTRIHLDPLSVDAVKTLAANSSIDPVVLHAATGGNPFFVTEILANANGTLPPTVRDAVLARAGRLSADAREVLDAGAALGTRIPNQTLLAVARVGSTAVDECVARGFLGDDRGTITFRHDLTRLALEQAMTPWRRRELHARALAALADDDDVVRRAHHAVAADDPDAVVDLARRAAAQCTALGAHREAAALLGSALRHVDRLPLEDQIALFEARALSCARIDQMDEALAAADVVLAHRRTVGDPRSLARWLTWLATTHRHAGNAIVSTTVLDEAIELLVPLGESVDLARALSTLAQRHMLLSESRAAIEVGRQAVAMAERLGVEDVAIHALNTVGTALDCAGEDTGIDLLRESLNRARAAGLDYDVARAYNNLQSQLTFGYRPREANHYFDEGLPVAVENDLRFFEHCMVADHCAVLVMEGRWDEAVEQASLVLGRLGTANVLDAGTPTLSGRSTRRWLWPGRTANSNSIIRSASPGWRQRGSLAISSGPAANWRRPPPLRCRAARRGSSGKSPSGACGQGSNVTSATLSPSHSLCTLTGSTGRPAWRGEIADAPTKRLMPSATATTSRTCAAHWMCSKNSARAPGPPWSPVACVSVALGPCRAAHVRPREQIQPGSPHVSSTYSPCWAKTCATPRSPTGWSSRPRPSIITCLRSSPSWQSRTGATR